MVPLPGRLLLERGNPATHLLWPHSHGKEQYDCGGQAYALPFLSNTMVVTETAEGLGGRTLTVTLAMVVIPL